MLFEIKNREKKDRFIKFINLNFINILYGEKLNGKKQEK
mgnify:CR=1 FL=1|jgi:hypothetical protein